MRRLVAVTFLTLPLLALPGRGADERPVVPGADKKTSAEPHPVEVRLADGSSVRMTLAQSHIEVTTKYGKLAVPVSEIRHVQFALRYPPGVPERIEAAAKDLGSDDFDKREKAAAELLSLQELSYPTLLKLTKSKDKEVARRAEELLAVLREKLPEEKFRFKTQDTIAADTFTVVGRIEGTTLKAKSQYFGEVTLGLADLRTLRRAGEGAEKELVLDLSKHGVPQGVWLNTGIEVTRDTVLEIRAGGESDLYPIGGERGAYRTTPNGSRQWGMARDQKVPGQLLGRIGERGKVFEIGERYDGTPGAEGKLYLRVGGSPWHNVPAGEYHVKITPR
jgi:hypothetical protein